MLFVGFRYFTSSIRRGRLRNVLRLTILSLSMNIGVLIAGVSLIRGFEKASLSKMLHIYGHAKVIPHSGMPQINPQIPDDVMSKFQRKLKIKTSQPPSLLKVVPKLETQGVLSKNRQTEGVLIRGLQLDDVDYVLGNYLREGSSNLETKDNLKPVIIGHRLAKRFNVKVNSEVDLLMRNQADVQVIPCIVRGIFDFGFADFDSTMIFINSNLVQEYMSTKFVPGMVYIDQPNKIDEYISLVKEMKPDLWVESWKEQNRAVQEMFDTQIRAVYILIGLYILSGIIQSVSSLYILLSERARDISILTMMGLSRSQRYGIFATYGLMIATSNTIVGVLTGILLSLCYPQFKDLYHNLTGANLIHEDALWVSDFTTELVMSDIMTIAIFTFSIMSCAMLIASHFVSRVQVLEGIKD